MKITEITGKNSGLSSLPAKDSKRISGLSEVSFHNQLKQSGDVQYEKISELVKKIVEQGQVLSQRVDVRELKLYRMLVVEFLQEAVSGSLKFTKQSMLDRRGRHKVFAVVRKINKELDELTADVLSNEKDHLVILKRLEDIRGLIIDLAT